MRSRSERRHHHKRMLNKVKKFDLYLDHDWDEQSKEKHQKKMVETRKPCSCRGCGNPRHHEKDKLTMQEKRIGEYEKYEE